MPKIYLLISLLWITSLCATTVSAESLHEQGCKFVFEESWAVDAPDVSHEVARVLKDETWDSRCWEYLSDDHRRWIGSQSSSGSNKQDSQSRLSPAEMIRRLARDGSNELENSKKEKAKKEMAKLMEKAKKDKDKKDKGKKEKAKQERAKKEKAKREKPKWETARWEKARREMAQRKTRLMEMAQRETRLQELQWVEKQLEKQLEKLSEIEAPTALEDRERAKKEEALTDLRLQVRALKQDLENLKTFIALEEKERAKKERAKKDNVKKEGAKQLKKEAAKQRRENELQLQVQREVEEARQRDQTQAYSAIGALVGQIRAKVIENWNKPPGLMWNLEAVISVKVHPTGEVWTAKVVKSSGDIYFDRSAENAIYKASPLPFPDEPRYYEFIKEFNFKFVPDRDRSETSDILGPPVWCANSKSVWKPLVNYCVADGKVFPSEAAATKEYLRFNASTITYLDGFYAGELVNGLPHGKGVFRNSNGRKYVGEWWDGKMYGQGTATWVDGTKYVGGWKDHKPHGQGTYIFSDGAKYVGQWKDGLRHGQGILTTSDNGYYVGEWKDDKKHGQGTHIWGNSGLLDAESRPIPGTELLAGAKYVGGWKDDKMHGQGTWVTSDGTKAVVEIKDGELQGTIYDKDGNVTDTLPVGIKIPVN